LVIILVIVGILVFVLLALRSPGAEKPKMEQEPQTVQVCPSCGHPATYVPEYNMYYCHNCQKYL
jgi:hypothetical protein